MLRCVTLLALVIGACGGDDPPGADTDAALTGLEVRPGEGIGPLRVGMRYGEARDALGPLEGAFGANRVAFGRYNSLRVEVVLVSADDNDVSDDAIIIGLGALDGGEFRGPVIPGALRDDVVAAFGDPDDAAGETQYYQEGFAVEYDGDRVLKVGIFRPYEDAPIPPEMRPAATSRPGR